MTIRLEEVMNRAGELYAEAKYQKYKEIPQPGPLMTLEEFKKWTKPEIHSDQVKALAQALVEFINEESNKNTLY